MRIIIDGDACPATKKIVSLGREYQVPVYLFCDNSHEIQDDYAKVIIVDTGYQSADGYIVKEVTSGDIVITQDYGVAVICLGKQALVIHPLGFLYEDHTINNLLEVRHQNAKLRRSGIRTKGPKKRTKQDDEKLLSTIEKLLQ